MTKRSMKEYRIWKAMKARCYSPSQTKGYYKAHGIEVCDRWKNSFENFLADMGRIPGDDYSIERIDVYGNYSPENCKWIPQRDQSKNRCNSIMVEYHGKSMCLKDLSRELSIKYTTIYGWYRKGQLIERIRRIA